MVAKASKNFHCRRRFSQKTSPIYVYFIEEFRPIFRPRVGVTNFRRRPTNLFRRRHRSQTRTRRIGRVTIDFFPAFLTTKRCYDNQPKVRGYGRDLESGICQILPTCNA